MTVVVWQRSGILSNAASLYFRIRRTVMVTWMWSSSFNTLFFHQGSLTCAFRVFLILSVVAEIVLSCFHLSPAIPLIYLQ
jgi:hypothetical protein